MATSLAQQLKKLAVPQTKLYVHETKKKSLLFDPKEAASIDRETFYEIGLSGLTELKKINESFSAYELTLFSSVSKDFERAMQTAEVNEKIDKNIKSFLIRLSPYLLLQCTHKALEWLINRFQIHKYNKDDFMKLILPYHETKIFVRCIQLMKFSNTSDRWSFLDPLRKPGIPLAKIVLFNHCSSNPSMLTFISDMTLEAVKEFDEKANSLTTLLAFYCATIVGTFENIKNVTEYHLTSILPVVLKSLSSSQEDFNAAGYMIIAELVVKTQLKEKTIRHLINKLLIPKDAMQYERIFLMTIICQYQDTLVPVSEKGLSNITPDYMTSICSTINKLISKEHDVTVFLKSLVTGILILVQKHSENLKRYKTLLEILISDVNMNSVSSELVIKCCIDEFTLKIPPKKSNNDSDMEVIDLDSSDFDEEDPIRIWYSQLMKSLERKYPNEFDSVLKKELRSKDTELPISAVLGFTPNLIKKLGNSYLFEKLYHQNPLMRNEAIKYIVEDIENLLNTNPEFVKEAIMDRFNDEDPTVISTLLTMDRNILLKLISKESIVEFSDKILHRGINNKTWSNTVYKTFQYLQSFNKNDFSSETRLRILPYLFSADNRSLETSILIVKSILGKSLLSLDDEFDINLYHTPEALSQAVFEILENGVVCIDIKSIIHILKTGDCVYKMLAIFISATNIQNNSNNDNMLLFKEIVDCMQQVNITAYKENFEFNGINIHKCIEYAQEEEIPIQIFIYFLEKILEKKGFCCTAENTWLDFESSDIGRNFKRMCYETIIYYANKKYIDSFNPLLQKFFDTKFANSMNKIDFVSNFICGNDTVINNEKDLTFEHVVQIRSIRILSIMCLSSNIDNILNSSVIVPSLLICLNNPNEIIRKHALDIINIILKKKTRKSSNETKFTLEFLDKLYERQEEILLDHQQIYFVLSTIFSSKVMRKKSQNILASNLISVLEIIKDSETPYHTKYQLLVILADINKEILLNKISSIALNLLTESSSATEMNINKSMTFKQILDKINELSNDFLTENSDAWMLIKKSFENIRLSLSFSDGTVQPLFSVISKYIDEEFFNQLSIAHSQELLSYVLIAGSYAQNTIIISSVSKLLKKIEIKAEHISNILTSMVTISENPSEQKTKKSKPSYPPPDTLNKKEWKLGITLLENIQNKRKLSDVIDIIPLLFNILRRCLQFEDQSLVEYSKQLLLTSILNCLEKLDTELSAKQKLNKLIDIESVVMCIRGTQNPQTHHHALILLSYAAKLLPEQVLNHIMAIFTFIGSSVLRHDDEYSFQIINKIIESIIPILVGLEENSKNLEKKVIPLLRIFADVCMDVPEHRRLPLYKKLITTLNPDNFLWSFLCLIFESHVVHGIEEKMSTVESSKKVLNTESTRLDFASSLILEFQADVIFNACVKIVSYVKSLPAEKPEEDSNKEAESNAIFSVQSHTAKQLRHYKYVNITFINNILSSPLLKQQLNSCEKENMEEIYKSLIVNILTYIQTVSRCVDENSGKPQAKYWKVMLHHNYEILDNVNMLLSVEMFITVVRGLLSHNLLSVRRKSMEILNTKLQHNASFFTECDKEVIYSLLPPLLSIITAINNDENSHKPEIELNQQTALLSLKLLVRLLGQDDPVKFKQILEIVTNLMHLSLSVNLRASVVLCLAELCSNLKAHSLAYLPKFMPSLIKTLKSVGDTEAPELVLLSVITAIYKIIETIPLFLSPYLEKLLYELSVLSGKWESNEQNNKNSPVVNKLTAIKSKISSTIAPRVLIPVVSRCYDTILKKGKYSAVGPVMRILAESFAGVSGAEFTSLQQDLTQFFLTALQFRNDYAGYDDTSTEQVDTIEGHVINALVTLILKLSESSFRPLYFKIYDWAVRSPTDNTKDRCITFYRLSSEIANNLKGLFVLFAGHFVKNAADMLDACNKSKTETQFFKSNKKSIYLIENILKTFSSVFLYDTQNFVNKDRFETIMQPLVDQLENDIGGMDLLKVRAKNLIIPCVAQFAIATADDSLWKPLNYQILLKTRHNDFEIRLLGLECMREMATKLGDSWLPLLPETVPFLAELLEDEVPEVETATQKAVQTLEAVLGEPLQKYF